MCEENKICNCKVCTKKSEWKPLEDYKGNKIKWESFDGVEPIQAPKCNNIF